MALTKDQKKIVNSALLMLAESRLRIEAEIHDATVISIKKRNVCRELEAMYGQLASVLKPRETTNAVLEVKEKLDTTADCMGKEEK